MGKRPREEPCHICGHYHDYLGGEPCGVCGHVISTETTAIRAAAMPSEILKDFLYVGSYDHASRVELLKAMGITHILSVSPSCQELYQNTFTYHTVKSSPADLQECFEFLDACHSQQKKVMVHCMTGTGRSPAVVIAYLMKSQCWQLGNSVLWVTDRHPATKLIPDDLARLQAIHQQVLALQPQAPQNMQQMIA